MLREVRQLRREVRLDCRVALVGVPADDEYRENGEDIAKPGQALRAALVTFGRQDVHQLQGHDGSRFPLRLGQFDVLEGVAMGTAYLAVVLHRHHRGLARRLGPRRPDQGQHHHEPRHRSYVQSASPPGLHILPDIEAVVKRRFRLARRLSAMAGPCLFSLLSSAPESL